MPRLTIPADKDPLTYVWGTKATHAGHKAAAFSSAVYDSDTFSLREFEAARITIADVNGCVLCLGWRSGRDVSNRVDQAEEAPEEFYDAVLAQRLYALPPRERLTADFARKFAVDHHAIDDAMWDDLHAHFTDDEIVELTLAVGAWIAFGRLNQVLDIDGGCRVGVPG